MAQRVGPLILFLQSPSGYLFFKVSGAPYDCPLLLFFSFICLTTKIASVVVTVDIIFLILLSNACSVVFPYHFQQDMCHSTCSQSLHRMCGVAGMVCHHTWACTLSRCLWHFCLKVCWQWLIVTAYLHIFYFLKLYCVFQQFHCCLGSMLHCDTEPLHYYLHTGNNMKYWRECEIFLSVHKSVNHSVRWFHLPQ